MIGSGAQNWRVGESLLLLLLLLGLSRIFEHE